MISACDTEDGIYRSDLYAGLATKMSKKDMDSALDFLSGEGHIYSTIDDDHFKAIDG